MADSRLRNCSSSGPNDSTILSDKDIKTNLNLGTKFQVGEEVDISSLTKTNLKTGTYPGTYSSRYGEVVVYNDFPKNIK